LTKMKQLPLFMLSVLITTLITACEKNDSDIPQLTSVNVVHAVVNASAVKVNTTGSAITYISYTDSIKFGASKLYSLVAGSATPLSIVATADTTKPLFNTHLSISAGEMYSLFLAGQYPAADTVWVKEELNNYTDSLIGIRFINLSPNSGPVKINIKGNTTQNETADLSYKQISTFKQYAAKSVNPNYQFEVRDAVTSTLLTSFTLAYTRFHNHTLVIKGLTGVTGTNAIGVFSVSPY
jgi:hypothetical protein